MKLTKLLFKEKEAPVAQPGDGLRSLKVSGVFRAVNFELYTKPNKVIMGIGLIALSISVGYIIYMRNKYENMGYYTAVNKDGEEVFTKKKSKWHS